MNQEIRNQLSLFLSENPLYRKFKIPDNSISDVWDLNGVTFPFHCKKENSIKTFELKITPKEFYDIWGKRPSNSPRRNCFTKDGLFSDIQHFKGVCLSCKEFEMDLLIAMFSEEQLHANGPSPNIFYLRKIGQFPPYEKTPPKDILNFLQPEDQEYYKKALMNISTGYGIGAFAYFRRIIQNEILRLIQKIGDIKSEHSTEIKNALQKYNTYHQMSSLIEILTTHLPASFNSAGNNPIKVLYEESSLALHELTDEDCLNKAIHIDKILRFTIKKIKEESTETVAVKEAFKSLRKDGKASAKKINKKDF